MDVCFHLCFSKTHVNLCNTHVLHTVFFCCAGPPTGCPARHRSHSELALPRSAFARGCGGRGPSSTLYRAGALHVEEGARPQPHVQPLLRVPRGPVRPPHHRGLQGCRTIRVWPHFRRRHPVKYSVDRSRALQPIAARIKDTMTTAPTPCRPIDPRVFTALKKKCEDDGSLDSADSQPGRALIKKTHSM